MKFASSVWAILVSAALLGCGGQNEGVPSSKDVTAAMREASPAPTPQSYQGAVQALYIAYFGRAADASGLESFSTQLAGLGAPIDILGIKTVYERNAGIAALINSFGNSTESRALFGGDTKVFITAIYGNILNRTPYPEGLAFWSSAIDSGELTRSGACLAILAGALTNTTSQGLADGILIQKKLKLASTFTNKVTGDNSSLYSGKSAAASVRTMLLKLTSTTMEEQFAALVDEEVALLTVESAPIADIAPFATQTVNSIVFLDGSASSDPRKLPLTYSWIFVSKPAGSAAVLSLASTARAFFQIDAAGNYVVNLTVNNGFNTVSKMATITASASVTPTTPTAPVGATAICKDGTYSYSATRSGTCSHHGGVRTWL